MPNVSKESSAECQAVVKEYFEAVRGCRAAIDAPSGILALIV
jgi:hypothetical protein